MSSYSTLAQAGKEAGEAVGLCWPEDREKIVRLVNTIRAEFYTLPSVHWTIPLCLPLHQFSAPGADGRSSAGKWCGLTAPAGIVNFLQVWNGSKPMTIIDRFALYPYDTEWHSADLHSARDMGDGFVFEEDPGNGCECFTLQFIARAREDVDKKMRLRYLGGDDREHNVELTLSDQWTCPEDQVKEILPNGIVLPDGLKGEVVARHGGTRAILATYKKWETVPNFRRFKIVADTASSGRTLAVLGQRDETPLFDDNDILETGNRLIWQDAARWLQLHKKTNADGTDQSNEVKFYRKFLASLNEEARRRRGLAKRYAIRFRGWTQPQSRLNRGGMTSRR